MSQNGKPRIGVFVCDCGTNIAGKVNVPEVVEFAAKLDDVAVAKEYKFMCSDPGQELIKKSIEEFNLSRVVVASCSPFPWCCFRTGFEPVLLPDGQYPGARFLGHRRS
jgi:heterodisulfide reductase subunit A